MNKAIIIGNLTRDIEVKYTQSNKAVGEFTVAVNNGKTADGQKIPADYIVCVVWNEQAENMKKYTSTGSKVAVEGRIKVDNWEDEQGKHYRTYVLASRVMFLNSTSNKPLPTDPNPEVPAPSNNAPQTSDPFADFANENEIDPSQFPF